MRLIVMLIGVGSVLAVGAAIAACAPLTAFNALMPADSEGALAASNIAYAPGPRQRLDIYQPQPAPTNAPVVVFFYGGGWSSGDRADYAFVGRALAARGFVTVVADYRLVPEVRFPDFLHDCAKAVAWTYDNIARYGGDRSRLFLMGHSAGAYNAVMLALDRHYLTAAGVAPTAIAGVAALAGPFDFLPFGVQSTIATFGNAPDPKVTQPISFVSTAAPPMMLATGTVDTTVLPRNSKRLAALLRAAGRPVVLNEYPNLGHVGILMALSRPLRSTASVLDDVTRFFHAQQPTHE